MTTELTTDDLVLFCIRLAAMVTVRVPLVEVLHLIAEESQHAEARDVFFKIRDDVAAGTFLADAFQERSKQPDDELWRVLKKGDEAGELAETLNSISLQLGTRANQESDLLPGKPRAVAVAEKNISPEDIALICRQLSSNQRAGVSLPTSLEMVAETSVVQSIKHLMSNLGKAVQSGDSLYDAFAAHPESFDAISCVLLAVAESSDELEIIVGYPRKLPRKDRAVSTGTEIARRLG